MGIKGNVGVGVIAIGTSDTVLLDPDSGDRERAAVSSAYLHNTSGGTIVVRIFESPDLTTASGVRIDRYSIDTDKSADISAIIGQGFSSTQNIIAIADIAGVEAKLTIVEYDDGS